MLKVFTPLSTLVRNLRTIASDGLRFFVGAWRAELYHFERKRQGKENRLLFPAPGSPPSHPNPAVTCHARLGGLLNFYQQAP